MGGLGFSDSGGPLKKKTSRIIRPAKIPGGGGNGGIEGGVPSQIPHDRCWFRVCGKEIHSLKTLK